MSLLLACAASLEGQNRAVAGMDTVREQNVGVLRPGDALRVIVFRDKELSGEYPIDSRGYVQIPGLGDILVGGLTPFAARERLVDIGRLRHVVDEGLQRGVPQEPADRREEEALHVLVADVEAGFHQVIAADVGQVVLKLVPVSYTHLTLPTTPYV